MTTSYTERFYRKQRDGSRASAQEIVPLVMELLAPRSVVDVGCGLGTWLAVFAAHGVEEVVGVDGPHVDPALVEISASRLLRADLARPLALGRRFDLAVSVEVGEHLPAAAAATFVESLVRLSDVVLFSAAVPFQGGTDHVNEQWPAYWMALFGGHGYCAVDGIRWQVWDNARVVPCYAQNVLLYANDAALARSPRLAAARDKDATPPAVIHPRLYADHLDPANLTVRHALALLRRAARNAFERRVLRPLRARA
jgi:SAM-dependent methyltransferase